MQPKFSLPEIIQLEPTESPTDMITPHDTIAIESEPVAETAPAASTSDLVLVNSTALVNQGRSIAELCREIVEAAATPIQGKRYVRVEGWQSIATAHGCVVSIRSVDKIDGGTRAIADLKRMSDGVILSTAEGFVGDDEHPWNKRPVYAVRAMAQTRAMSRVCRGAFAHVVLLMNAGLSTTPAEEVPDGGFDSPEAQPQPVAKPVPRSLQRAFKGVSAARAATPVAASSHVSTVKTPAPYSKPDYRKVREVEQFADAGWLEYPIGFGKNKGVPVGDLKMQSFKWYVEEWSPRPRDDGSLWTSDVEFKALIDDARARLNYATSEPVSVEEPANVEEHSEATQAFPADASSTEDNDDLPF